MGASNKHCTLSPEYGKSPSLFFVNLVSNYAAHSQRNEYRCWTARSVGRILTVAEPLILQVWWIAALVIAIVIFAAMVQAGLGMGFGLTAAPLLALIDPALVPGPTLYLGMFSSLLGVYREPKGVVWREIGIGAFGRMFGVLLGGVLLYNLTDMKTFSLVFGVMVGLAVTLSAFGWQLPFTNANLVAMSTVSGVMGIITSVGAPPMALLYSQRPAKEARPTLAAFFAVGCGVSIIGLHLAGWGGWRDFWLALLMLPGVIVGTIVARLFLGRFDQRFKPILLCVSGMAAFLLIVRGLT